MSRSKKTGKGSSNLFLGGHPPTSVVQSDDLFSLFVLHYLFLPSSSCDLFARVPPIPLFSFAASNDWCRNDENERSILEMYHNRIMKNLWPDHFYPICCFALGIKISGKIKNVLQSIHVQQQTNKKLQTELCWVCCFVEPCNRLDNLQFKYSQYFPI